MNLESLLQRLQWRRWLDERLPSEPLVHALASKKVPSHRYSFWYFFGGLTLFFFLVQVVTGILLALYYQPTPERAYESVRSLIVDVPHGWLIRSIHSWSANLMVGSLFVHMFSVFLMKSYRKPRELMWVSGALLMLLVLGFCFTGYLLPWDAVAYFATLIGTEVPKSIPILGVWGVSLLKGGNDIGAHTLTRMYTIHIVLLPLLSIAVVSFHLAMNQILGSSVPLSVKQQKAPVPFFPNFLYRDLIAWTVGLAALLTLAVMVPWGLGEKADTLASAPAGIKPEWYFLPLYETLKLFPSTLLFMNGELAVNLLVAGGIAFWIAIPFVDVRSSRQEKSPIFTVLGIILILYLIGTITTAYAGG